MKREDVYAQLNKEREKITLNMQNPNYRPLIAEELNSIDTLLRRTKDHLTDYESPEKSLKDLRTIAALAIRCLEHWDKSDSFPSF